VKSLSARLLLFNIMLLFLPMGSLLYLDTYENQLLSSQENSMIQQGRLLSSALGGRDMPAESLAAEADKILENLAGRVDSRLRVVDAGGNLLADSATITAASGPVREKAGPEPDGGADAGPSPNSRLLYRAAVYPVNAVKRLLFPPSKYSAGEFYSGRRVLLGPEIRAALEGRYGAATRYSGGQVSVNLYSAIPIFGAVDSAADAASMDGAVMDAADAGGGKVIGAVLVSRSTYGILVNLYQIRLDIIRIFIISLCASLILSLGLSLTITLPIKKLKLEAEGVLDKTGHFSGHIRGLKRKDEIGDLSRSLSALSRKLEKRIAFIETFTSDLFHELKNPIAAIRAQVELSLASPVKEEKLLRGIEEEERRIEGFLARLRELSRVDNVLEQEAVETVDLGQFLPLLLERYQANTETIDSPAVRMVFENKAGGPAPVRLNPDRLIQAVVNPLENAVSFSPPGEKVMVELAAETPEPCPAGNGAKGWSITIDDSGPGIREESGDRYFQRFYSERSQEERDRHSGLGLAIAAAIVQGYGGSCSLTNRKDDTGRVLGGRFTLTLPASP
jgi:two-component system sensor histidine kinase ChvG